MNKKEVIRLAHLRYNNLEVVAMAVGKEHVKALIDRLSQEQLQALWVILNSMAWPEDEITSEEAKAVEEGRKEISEGKCSRAEDVWRELGI